MRKVTREAIHCFLSACEYHKGNTRVELSLDPTYQTTKIVTLYLHSHPIAKVRVINDISMHTRNCELGLIIISNCGYFTNTTKERLNGIPGVRIHQKNYEWYLNGQPWDGTPTVITNK